jgi:DUF1365 family protein
VEQRADKVMHVSPFNPVQGHYRFRFMRSQSQDAERTVARIDYCDEQGVLVQTSVSGVLEPLTPAAQRRALWRYPLMTLGVVWHIHLQAARLWLKKVPFFRKPQPPEAFVTR